MVAFQLHMNVLMVLLNLLISGVLVNTVHVLKKAWMITTHHDSLQQVFRGASLPSINILLIFLLQR